MFGDIFNSTPGVGHLKGFYHYAKGDSRAGDTAMYESTRTTAVLTGGALGALGGPAGMVTGALAGGAFTDSVASLASDEPRGIVQGVTDIVDDVSDGKVPIGSCFRTSFMVGSDVIGGMNGGAITRTAMNRAAGSSMGREMFKQAVKSQAWTMTTRTVNQGGSHYRRRSSKYY